MPDLADHPSPPPPTPHRVDRDLPWWARNSTQPYLPARKVRTWTRRSTLIGLVAVAVMGVALWWILTASEVKDVEKTDFGFYAYKQSTDALIGGCGPIYSAPASLAAHSGTVPAKDRSGIDNRLTYKSVVPMFGEFWDQPAPSDQTFWSRTEPNPPKPENLLRNQWDGAVVLYYSNDVTDDEVALIKEVLEQRPELGLIAVPWDVRVRGPLPEHRKVAFATWNASQSCHRFVPQALYDFRDTHPATEAPGHDGTPPPVLSTKPPVNVVAN